MRGLRMVCDAEICIAARLCALSHLFERVDPIGGISMRVQQPTEVFVAHQPGQLSLIRERKFVSAFAQFGLDKRQAKPCVNRGLLCRRNRLFAGPQAVGSQRQSLLARAGLKRGYMLW